MNTLTQLFNDTPYLTLVYDPPKKPLLELSQDNDSYIVKLFCLFKTKLLYKGDNFQDALNIFIEHTKTYVG